MTTFNFKPSYAVVKEAFGFTSIVAVFSNFQDAHMLCRVLAPSSPKFKFGVESIVSAPDVNLHITNY